VTTVNPPPGMPAGPSPAEPSPEEQRQVLQGLLGEHHGLLTTVMYQCLSPSSGMLSSSDPEMRELLEHLRDAYPGVSIAFGQVQGELNTGNHDEGLDDVGLAKDQLGPKRKGFRYNLRRFYGGLRNIRTKPGFIQAAKHGLRAVKWGNIIVGSLSKELQKIRGMEAILEFGEVVVETLEQVIDGQETAGPDRKQ
jgi:hypothetical protein